MTPKSTTSDPCVQATIVPSVTQIPRRGLAAGHSMAGISNHCETMKMGLKTGFTLTELVVTLALAALLGIILAPALARTNPNTKAVQCLNNNRQLCQAWRMYAGDCGDQIVYATTDDNISNPLNQYVWVRGYLDFNPGNRANWDSTYLRMSPLWPYCGQSGAIWRCPFDPSYVVVNGERKPRIRSIEMNFYLGGSAGTYGGWSSAATYRVFLKTTELTPSPAQIFVFLDVRPEAINWGAFLTDMTGGSRSASSQYLIYDFPGNLHNGACGFSFGDGHTEMKRWRDPRTMPRVNALPSTPLASPNNPDVAWLQDHATRNK